MIKNNKSLILLMLFMVILFFILFVVSSIYFSGDNSLGYPFLFITGCDYVKTGSICSVQDSSLLAFVADIFVWLVVSVLITYGLRILLKQK